MEKKDFVYYDNTYGVLKKLKHDVVLTERIVETILQIFFLFYYAYLIYNNVNNAYANGAKNIKLSILSNIPPCPGIKLL